MSRPVVITDEHVQRAYAQLRRADWPPLDVLQQCHQRYLIVRGQAVNIAEGKPLPPEPVATAPPAAPTPKPAAWPPPPHRRRDDALAAPAPFSARAAAAGEYVHPDE